MDFAVKIKRRFDFTENELKYILGAKHLHKLKDILRFSEKITTVKPIKEEASVAIEEDKKEISQPSLFDF